MRTRTPVPKRGKGHRRRCKGQGEGSGRRNSREGRIAGARAEHSRTRRGLSEMWPPRRPKPKARAEAEAHEAKQRSHQPDGDAQARANSPHLSFVSVTRSGVWTARNPEEEPMPSKSANVKNEKQYEALKEKGMSSRAARIANSPKASSHGGKKSGSGSSSKQGNDRGEEEAGRRVVRQPCGSRDQTLAGLPVRARGPIAAPGRG